MTARLLPYHFFLLSIEKVGLNVGGNLGLPLVTVIQQLLLVVEQLLARLGGKLEVGAFDNGIDWTGLLTEATVYAFCHVDIVARRPPTAVWAFFRLDCYSLR